MGADAGVSFGGGCQVRKTGLGGTLGPAGFLDGVENVPHLDAAIRRARARAMEFVASRKQVLLDQNHVAIPASQTLERAAVFGIGHHAKGGSGIVPDEIDTVAAEDAAALGARAGGAMSIPFPGKPAACGLSDQIGRASCRE